MVDTQLILEVAARAGTDPRTAARALRGESVRGLAGSRIRRALAELGLAPVPMAIDSRGALMASAPHQGAR